MKKAFWVLLLLSFFITTKTSAAYPLKVSATDTIITAEISGVTVTDGKFRIIITKAPNPSIGEYSATSVFPEGSSSGPAGSNTMERGLVSNNTDKVVLSAKVLPDTQYYVSVIYLSQSYLNSNGSGRPFPMYVTENKPIKTTSAPTTITPGNLTFDYDKELGSVLIKGSLDISKNPKWKSYTIKIQYSKNAISTEDASLNVYKSHNTTSTEIGIAEDGKYHLKLTNISPSVLYNIRQSITAGTQIPTETNGGVTNGTFKSDTGYTTSTNTSATQSDFESRSYRLLAPFPGFTLFLDPDLCAEQAQINPNQLCDINDILNLAFKILIGAAAVLLVLRIMFEGYKYITSDIPGLKTSAKSNIVEAGLGLLLALSSFLILNTINPKLVENSIDAGRLEIGVTEDEEDAYPMIGPVSGTVPTGVVAACTSGIQEIVTQGGKFWACKTIAPSFKTMMDTAYTQGIKLAGGGFRTRAQQVALRASHCGASNVYNEKAVCKPPTAYPGKSQHESGLAFDLTCEGKLISTQDNKCFIWLKNNAATYGLKNFAKEPWHWSTTGR